MATDLTDKVNCSTKSICYYGGKASRISLKEREEISFSWRNSNSSSISERFIVFKKALANKYNRCFFGDKIYVNNDFFANLKKEKNTIKITPIGSLTVSHKKKKEIK